MLRFAVVNGQKCRPFKQGRGTCPTCGGAVIAKCGSIKAHHWAHESIDDCDLWSEHVGPWHLSWQDPVQDEFVEVTIAPHRADIRNSAGTVIELQHSSLSPEDIARREAFYGDMVWVFDATERFPAMPSGDRDFFSLERTEHIKACQKKVFLDCGDQGPLVPGVSGLSAGFAGGFRLVGRRFGVGMLAGRWERGVAGRFSECGDFGFENGDAPLIMVDDGLQQRPQLRRQCGDLFGRDGRRRRRHAGDVANSARCAKANSPLRLRRSVNGYSSD